MAELSDFIDQAEIDAAIHGPDKLPEVIDAELALANDAVDYARALAPVDTENFKDSIHVYQDDDRYGIQSDDEAANIIEYGSEDTPEFAVFTRTAEHFGGVTH